MTQLEASEVICSSVPLANTAREPLPTPRIEPLAWFQLSPALQSVEVRPDRGQRTTSEIRDGHRQHPGKFEPLNAAQRGA